MSNYVSFSLWGDLPIYNIGTIRNAQLINDIYPDWKMIVYYDETVPNSTIDELNKLDVILVDMTDSGVYGPFWRFFAYDEDDCEYVVFRDSDSRISTREFLAVQEWIESGKTLHVMRDHPAHRIPYGNTNLGILAGMWGIKKTRFDLSELIFSFNENKNLSYGSDQTFLINIYDRFQKDMIVHDEFFGGKQYPIKRNPGEFIGGRIDENDKPVGDDYKILL